MALGVGEELREVEAVTIGLRCFFPRLLPRERGPDFLGSLSSEYFFATVSSSLSTYGGSSNFFARGVSVGSTTITCELSPGGAPSRFLLDVRVAEARRVRFRGESLGAFSCALFLRVEPSAAFDSAEGILIYVCVCEYG